MAVKLFVGGLSFSTSNERLREAFAAVGSVESASVVTDRDTGRSRGFGFVEMATPEEAEQAISRLNGTNLDGRTIQVEKAKAPGSGGGGDRRGGGGGSRGGFGGGGGAGGQEIRRLAEVRWLLGHGWGALIACQPDSPLFAEAKASAIPVEPVRMRSATDVGALLRLRRLIRDRDVSLVHTHSSIDSWV